ncbi:MAG: hypothetical protein D6732_18435 [Methanobacteriota archaeon]|nr:MAG: hypothetical protein D6732_18435 [Euryarchaeota archaeon]
MEKQDRPLSSRNIRIIFLILTFFPVIYLILLFVFSSTETETSPDPTFDTILPIGWAIISVVDILLAFFIFLPKFNALMQKDATMRNAREAFSHLMIVSTLLEAIGVFGLIIGIMQIFVTGTFAFPIPSLFIVISFLFCLYIYMTYVPRLTSMIDQAMGM